MYTMIYDVDENNIDIEIINKAAYIIKKSGTVVFPTETVYGLGANGLDADACKKIFIAKGRPSDNPLILHISAMEQLDNIAKDIPDVAYKLAQKYWPGPLTMIFNKKECVCDIVSAGLNTVAVRMPSNKIARLLIQETGCPIAAPSANTSGKPSPTNGKHVIEDMNGKVDIILDGGQCDVGLESTVVDLTGEIPTILRPGAITKEQIEIITNKCLFDPYIINSSDNMIPKSPGQKYRHYSPKAELILYKGNLEEIVFKILKDCEKEIAIGKEVGIMATSQTVDKYKSGIVLNVGDRDVPKTIANLLFYKLREFDEKNVDIILAESFEDIGLGKAIMNRLGKAASKIK